MEENNELNELKENLLNETENQETTATESCECACECAAENCDIEEAPCKKSSKRLIIAIIAAVIGVAAIVAIVMACLGKFSKYPGFKKDRDTGIYYQFYGAVNDTADMPKTGDLIGFLFSLRTADSTLIPMMFPQQMIMDSLYKGDMFGALRMMHVGDSATFIFNGQDFFENMFQGQEYPFGEEPLYMDIKLLGLMPKAEFEKAKAEYEAEMKAKSSEEATLIADYVKANNITVQPSEQGIYIVTTKKGNGAKLQAGQTAQVHYTGKLLDGTEFDSSIKRGAPFEVQIGAGQVIPGWEYALSQMSVGEKATVIIPSALAYGERGNQVIPPYSPLVFEMEIIGIAE